MSFPIASLKTALPTSCSFGRHDIAPISPLRRDWRIARNAHGSSEFGGVAACVCVWSHSCISFELKRRLRLIDVDSRKR